MRMAEVLEDVTRLGIEISPFIYFVENIPAI